MFQEDSFDDIVLTKLSLGATAMKEKLVTYASSQLPDWDNTKKVLSTIKPTNDTCESILGPNDYITAITQLTRSTMVAAKKNQTIKALHETHLTIFALQQ